MLLILGLTGSMIFAMVTWAEELDETFDAGFDQWEILDEPDANSAPSNWQVVPDVAGHANVLSPKSNIYGGDAGAFEPSRGTWAAYQDGDWADAIFQVDMHFTDDDVPGVAFRWMDENNHYIFDLMQQARGDKEAFKRLRKVVDGTYTELAIVHDGGYDKDVWYTARIEYSGSNIKIFWDNELLLEVEDNEPGLMGGTVVLSSWGMTDVFFDNISVNLTTAVEPAGKLSQLWGAIKAGLQLPYFPSKMPGR